MKKGDKCYRAIFVHDDTPMIETYHWEVSTVNKNGIYFRCLDQHCESLKDSVLPNRTPMEMGYRSTKNKALRALLPEMKKTLADFEGDEYNAHYTKEEQKKIATRIKGAITKIERLPK